MADVENPANGSAEPIVESEETLFDPSLKKKKKSSKPKTEAGESVDTVTDMLAELSTKKKKKKSEKKADFEDGETKEGTPEPEAGEDGEFVFKAKKKKKSKAASAASAFDQALEEAGVDTEVAASAAGGEAGETVHESQVSKYSRFNAEGEPDFTYEELLDRFFKVLRENNPDLAGDRTGVKYKIPPPQVARDGNKKSLFSNVKDIADRMHRPTEHVIQFLFAELGTSGSVDGSNRLVIKGRFQQKQIESVLRRYIMEYVTCKTCKSVNTRLTKENRLYFLDCNSCGSRRSVSSIKTGYQAIIKRGRK